MPLVWVVLPSSDWRTQGVSTGMSGDSEAGCVVVVSLPPPAVSSAAPSCADTDAPGSSNAAQATSAESLAAVVFRFLSIVLTTFRC